MVPPLRINDLLTGFNPLRRFPSSNDAFETPEFLEAVAISKQKNEIALQNFNTRTKPESNNILFTRISKQNRQHGEPQLSKNRINGFRKLPPELRKMIWELCLPDGRNVPLEWEGSPFYEYDESRGFESCEPLPAILHINHESRTFALRHLVIVDKNACSFYKTNVSGRPLRPFCFNPDRDSLCVSMESLLSWPSNVKYLTGLLRLLEGKIPSRSEGSQSALDRITSLEIRDVSHAIEGFLFPENHAQTLDFFPLHRYLKNLKSLCFTFDQRRGASTFRELGYVSSIQNLVRNDEASLSEWREQEKSNFISGQAPIVYCRPWEWFDGAASNWIWQRGGLESDPLREKLIMDDTDELLLEYGDWKDMQHALGESRSLRG